MQFFGREFQLHVRLNWDTPFHLATSRIPWKIHESKPKHGSKTNTTPIPLIEEQHTEPKMHYGGSPSNYRLNVPKIRQLSVNEPYFSPIKNKDGIIMYIVDHQL